MKKMAILLSVLYLSTLTVFAFLSKESGSSMVENLPNVLPWFLGWGFLGLAWKYPKVGGICFILFGAASIFFFHTYKNIAAFIIVSFPLFVIGILFSLLKQKKKEAII